LAQHEDGNRALSKNDVLAPVTRAPGSAELKRRGQVVQVSIAHCSHNLVSEAYLQFVAAGPEADLIWQNLRQQIYLGDDNFVRLTQKQVEPCGDELSIPQIQRRPHVYPVQSAGSARHRHRFQRKSHSDT
jgi:hypothetical protein